MGKLFFGGSLRDIETISLSGFQPGQLISNNLLDAMIQARNSVGLNRRFKPVVLVIEMPSLNFISLSNNQNFQVTKPFHPEIHQILLLKIDFTLPNLVRVNGNLSPFYLSQSVRNKQESDKIIAR